MGINLSCLKRPGCRNPNGGGVDAGSLTQDDLIRQGDALERNRRQASLDLRSLNQVQAAQLDRVQLQGEELAQCQAAAINAVKRALGHVRYLRERLQQLLEQERRPDELEVLRNSVNQFSAWIGRCQLS